MRTSLAALLTLALAAVAGSPAQAATYHSAPFCGSLNPNSGYQPMTLQGSQACTFVPTAVSSFHASWDVVRSGSTGFGVCVAVLEYPPGWPYGRPLNPTGSGPDPNSWRCVTPGTRSVSWAANNPFGAVYGQAVLVNYSNAAIRTRPSNDPSATLGRIFYFS